MMCFVHWRRIFPESHSPLTLQITSLDFCFPPAPCVRKSGAKRLVIVTSLISSSLAEFWRARGQLPKDASSTQMLCERRGLRISETMCMGEAFITAPLHARSSATWFLCASSGPMSPETISACETWLCQTSWNCKGSNILSVASHSFWQIFDMILCTAPRRCTKKPRTMCTQPVQMKIGWAAWAQAWSATTTARSSACERSANVVCVTLMASSNKVPLATTTAWVIPLLFWHGASSALLDCSENATATLVFVYVSALSRVWMTLVRQYLGIVSNKKDDAVESLEELDVNFLRTLHLHHQDRVVVRLQVLGKVFKCGS